MFDNDMYIINRSKLFNSYSKVYILSDRFIHDRFELNRKVSQFKQVLIEKINKLIPNSVVLESTDMAILCDHI